MSIFFVTRDGDDLWNPASAKALAFHAQAAAVGALLGLETGLGPIVSDECVVEAAAFGAFEAAFVARVLGELERPTRDDELDRTFSIVLALGEALGLTRPSRDPRLEPFLSEGRARIGR
jgi:hypothetical protein